MTVTERQYREIPIGHGVCAVCDEIVRWRLSDARMHQPIPLGVHGPRSNRCPGSRQPGKPWLEATRLPTWDEMSELDQGRALLHVWKCYWERDALYATENYPCQYRDDPVLSALPVEIACRHARAAAGRLEKAQDRLGMDEFDRLYNLACDFERGS